MLSMLRPAWLRRLAADESGVSAIITAIALTTLLGFCGLAVDVVMWEVNQRALQGTADQAALAAATAYRNAGATGALGTDTDAQNAAYATAIRNGYDAGNITVAAFNNGSTCQNNGCLQVTITQQQPRYFTRIFTSSAVNDSASAVGTCSGCGSGTFTATNNGGTACVMALDASGKGVVTSTGGAVLALTACNLYNNSPQTDATVVSNNAAIEGCSASNPCGSQAFLAQPNNPGGIDIPVTTSAAPAPDPYAGLTPPTIASSCQQLPNPPTDVPSGTYCGGNKFQNQTITFADNAVIVITGGLDLHSGSTSLTGTGVTIYVESDGTSSESSTINATTTVNITAPTTGPYAGIALWFAGGSGVTYNGANGSAFSGAIYAPGADVSYSGNAGSSSSCTRLVAGSVTLAGSSAAMFDNSGCPITASPVLTSSGVTGSTSYNGQPVLIQ
jgi:Flp pilus assembly protein TadG